MLRGRGHRIFVTGVDARINRSDALYPRSSQSPARCYDKNGNDAGGESTLSMALLCHEEAADATGKTK
jgi:hypothetical protein